MAHAVDLTVANTSDSGLGSLRQTLLVAQPADRIVFAAGLDGQTITLGSELIINQELIIDTEGLAAGLTLNGGGAERLIRVASGGDVTVRGLTLTGGKGIGAANSGFGGAIYNEGSATIERCSFKGNSVSNYGGCIHNALNATLVVSGSSFTVTSGMVGNSAGFYGGAISNSGVLTVNGSTFDRNTSSFEGGAIYSDFSSTLTINNSTFFGNHATIYGGAVFNGSPRMILASSTVVENSADQIGGGVYNDFFGTPSATIENTIVTQNTAPESTNIFGPWVGGNNFTSGDPKLSPLGNFGGPTKTMPPLPDSPVIDAGGATTLLTDQRGQPRVLRTAPDIGAFEIPFSDYNPAGLTIYSRVDISAQSGVFEISTDPDFRPVVTTFAGTGTAGFLNGARLSAKLGYPSGVAQDSLGNTFFADTGNHRIRMIGSDGLVVTIAGDGNFGLANGPGPTAQFAFPSALAVGPDDNVYVADTFNHRICKLTRPAVEGGVWTVTNLAGTGIAGFVEGAGTVARFNLPYGLTLDAGGNVFVADSMNHRIRKVTPVGAVSTYAGAGTAGGAFAVMANTTISGCETTLGTAAITYSGSVFELLPGMTVAGPNIPLGTTISSVTDPTHFVLSANAMGSATGLTFTLSEGSKLAAKFNNPFGVVFDSTGNLLVADRSNNRIRKIDSVSGIVTTFAGQALAGYANGTGTAAQFSAPSALASDGAGSIYVADESNHRIRKIDSTGLVTSVAGTGVAGLLNGKSDIARFNAPTGVAVGLDGNLLVADAENQVIRRVVIKPLTVPSTPFADFYGVPEVPGVQVKSVLDVNTLGLDPGVTYYFRWVTTGGTAQLLGQSFYLYDFPTVVTQAASSLTPSSAVLNADVDPKAGRTVVTFEYSTDPGLLNPYEVTTLAGSDVAGFADDTGPAARFSNPSGVVANAAGDVFVADRLNHRIRKITPGGVVTTFAGSGVPGFANGTGTAAKFEKPTGLAIDASGNLYVADEASHRIRMITPAGVVTTFAGTGVAGFAEGGATSTAKFLYPSGVAVDADGNVYVADSGNHRIRKITAGIVSTLAGTGVAGFNDGATNIAQFSSPQALAVDASGVVFVADTGNHSVRVIAADNVTTFAGDGSEGMVNGPGANAKFSSPRGIVVDASGVATITDSGNHRIRQISVDGVVSTLAGSGNPGRVDSPAVGLYPVTACQFDLPSGIAIDGSGALLVTQEGTLRKIARSATLPTLTVTPDADGTGERALLAAIDQPLLYGATYYFQARGTSYRDSITGGVLSFVTPRGDIAVFAGNSTSAAALSHLQTEVVEYGNTPTGQAFTRDFTISNPGTWPLTVSTVDLPAGFQLTGGTGVINPLASSTFQITLTAATAGNFSGDVVIHNDAPEKTVFSFPISGVVLDPPALTTLEPTAVGTGTATFNATVNPRDSSTTVWFEWSQDPDFDGVMVSTMAGSASGYLEGNGIAAKFNQPSGIAVDAGGNTFVADTQNHRIRKIAPDGTTSTFAGTGVAGFANGAGNIAQFDQPTGLVISATGTLFVTDSNNHRIRAIDSTGVVTTYSGLGTVGFTDGIATAARFNKPSGLAIDNFGVLYVADTQNHRIRKVAIDGSVSTLSGTGEVGSANGAGSVAEFNGPTGLARDSAGFVYVTEAGSHAVRKIAPDGFTSVLAGDPVSSGFTDASGTAARFTNPVGLAVGVGGGLYVADKGNHRIRSISPDGSVTTLAGSATPGVADGFGEVAQFFSPFSLATTASGGVIVGEFDNSTLRKITSLQILLQAATGLVGTDDIAVELPVTGLPATYYYRSIASNGGGTTIGGIIAITPPSSTPYEAWQLATFGADASNPLVAGSSACPSGDGMSNLLKYAFGLDPHIAKAGCMPVMGYSGGMLSLTYTKVLAATDLTYTVEWSSDLANWSSTGVTEQTLSGDTETEEILATAPAAPVEAKFLRVHITLQ